MAQAHFQGDIYEFFIIDGVVNSTDLQNIEAYLAQKWGITLPNSVNSIHAAKDSSGNNHHGILKKKFNPTNLSSPPKLWLDASELTSAGATWTDKSGNGNDATKTGSPAIISNFQNGKTVMHSMEMLTIMNGLLSTISEVYSGSFRQIVQMVLDFYLETTTILIFTITTMDVWGTQTSANIRNGNLRVNGLSING